jgi:hypothetical protein
MVEGEDETSEGKLARAGLELKLAKLGPQTG